MAAFGRQRRVAEKLPCVFNTPLLVQSRVPTQALLTGWRNEGGGRGAAALALGVPPLEAGLKLPDSFSPSPNGAPGTVGFLLVGSRCVPFCSSLKRSVVYSPADAWRH